MRAIYSSWNSQIRYEKIKSNLMPVTNPENKCVEYKISSSYGILKVDLTFLKVQQLSFQYNVKVQNISQIMRNDECGWRNMKFLVRNIVYSYNVQVEKYEIVTKEI